MKVRTTMLALSVLLAVGGCANKSYLVLLENPQGGVGTVFVSGKNGTQQVNQAMHAVDLDGGKPPQPVDRQRFEADFAAALAAQPAMPSQYLLYFQTGTTVLTDESRELLSNILIDVKNRPVSDVSVIGHTDTVGSAPANAALALKRAQDIATLLTQQGLAPFALTVESHGEHSLLIPTPDETDEPRNRRVEVSVR